MIYGLMLWVRRKTLASTPDGSRCDKPEYVHRKYPSQTAQDATNRSTGGESHTPPVAAAAAADIEAQLRQDEIGPETPCTSAVQKEKNGGNELSMNWFSLSPLLTLPGILFGGHASDGEVAKDKKVEMSEVAL